MILIFAAKLFTCLIALWFVYCLHSGFTRHVMPWTHGLFNVPSGWGQIRTDKDNRSSKQIALRTLYIPCTAVFWIASIGVEITRSRFKTRIGKSPPDCNATEHHRRTIAAPSTIAAFAIFRCSQPCSYCDEIELDNAINKRPTEIIAILVQLRLYIYVTKAILLL